MLLGQRCWSQSQPLCSACAICGEFGASGRVGLSRDAAKQIGSCLGPWLSCPAAQHVRSRARPPFLLLPRALCLPHNLCVRVRVCARSSACVTKALVTVWIFTVKRSCAHLEPLFTLSPSKRLCFGFRSAVALAPATIM